MDATNKKLITVTLDLDALRKVAREFANANDGSLSFAWWGTPDDLQRAWRGMAFLFLDNNKEFKNAVISAISVLQEVHHPRE